MENEIKKITKDIVREIENFNSSNISNQDELQNITQHGKSEKLKEFDSKIVEVLKTFGIQEYDPKNLEHEELVINLRINEFESIVEKENIEKKKKITILIEKLQEASIKTEYIFYDSPLEVYESYVIEKKDKYKPDYIDSDFSDFLKNEIIYRLNPVDNRYIETNKKYHYNDFIYQNNNFNITELKKIEFLKTMLLNEGYTLVDKNIEEGVSRFFRKTEKPLRNSSNLVDKLKWTGSIGSLGFILANLASLGYIEAPKKKDGDINYSKFASQVINSFDDSGTKNTLMKYLNLESDKGMDAKDKFDAKDFEIPHSKLT